MRRGSPRDSGTLQVTPPNWNPIRCRNRPPRSVLDFGSPRPLWRWLRSTRPRTPHPSHAMISPEPSLEICTIYGPLTFQNPRPRSSVGTFSLWTITKNDLKAQSGRNGIRRPFRSPHRAIRLAPVVPWERPDYRPSPKSNLKPQPGRHEIRQRVRRPETIDCRAPLVRRSLSRL
jgi:hypothetical protein